MPIQLRSSAFQAGQPIPAKYTCQGGDTSPPLEVSGVPQNARALALIVDDPDAPRGDWVHWVVFGIPAQTSAISEGSAPAGSTQGKNDFGKMSWGGPCPPPGGPHRYFFRVYALDSELDLRAGATKQQLLDAMRGHVLGEAELMGTYERSS